MMIGVEKIIGWALSHHFMSSSETSMKESKLVISSERFIIIELFCCISKNMKQEMNGIWILALWGSYFFFLASCSISYGLNILQGIQNENKSLKKSLKVKLYVYSHNSLN